MHRTQVLEALRTFEKTWQHSIFAGSAREFAYQDQTIAQVNTFARNEPLCFERSHLPGHFTGSALVVTPDLNKVLLTFHAKLEKWLQLGGHADGHTQLHEVALREAEEESGLSDLQFFDLSSIFGGTSSLPSPIDIDIHLIPECKGELAHHHYDFRYLIVATGSLDFIVSEESLMLRWVDVEDVPMLTSEPSMVRQACKLMEIRAALFSKHKVHNA
jgi:8-oxo-dGTP pyrophosphatase MutT (NUDIX family)